MNQPINRLIGKRALALQRLMVYRRYEAKRRLDLAKQSAFWFALIVGAIFLIVTVVLHFQPPPNRFIYLTYELLAISVAMFMVGAHKARQDRAFLAANCIAIASGIAVVTFYIFMAMNFGLDSFVLTGFATFGLVMVLVGLIGNPSLIISFGVLISLCLIGIVIGTNHWSLALPRQSVFVLVEGLVQQGVFTMLLLALFATYERTIKDLREKDMGDELKNKLIKTYVHEVRQPISALMNRVNTLAIPSAETTPLSPEEYEKWKEETKKLLDQILNLRSLRLDDSVRQLFPVEVQQVVHDALLAFPDLDVSRLRCNIKPDLMIMADQYGVVQVLSNLIKNAVKYSQPTDFIDISAHEVAARHHRNRRVGWVDIAVRDHGDGIPRDLHDKIFELDYRMDPDSEVEGQGLGLWISRDLAESMDGTLNVASEGMPGQGSTFTLRLERDLGVHKPDPRHNDPL